MKICTFLLSLAMRKVFADACRIATNGEAVKCGLKIIFFIAS